jgi:hypothetical protein
MIRISERKLHEFDPYGRIQVAFRDADRIVGAADEGEDTGENGRCSRNRDLRPYGDGYDQ